MEDHLAGQHDIAILQGWTAVQLHGITVQPELRSTRTDEVTHMSEIIFVVEEAPEGGLLARALGESIFTQADSLEELHAQVRDAVRCHFEEGTAPKLIRLHFVRDEIIPA